jgi:DHA3 family tetracycline resistance protein-like MFS transporter
VLWIGGLSVAAMLGAIVLTEALRRRVDALRPARLGRLLVALQTAGVLAVLVFALAGDFWLAAAASLTIGMLRASVSPLFDTWLVTQTEPATRATVYSMAAQVDAAGQIMGGPPVGLIGERATVRAALVCVAAMLAPAVGLFAAALRRSREREASRPETVTVTDGG